MITFLIDFDVETNFIFKRLIKKCNYLNSKKIAKQKINVVDNRVV